MKKIIGSLNFYLEEIKENGDKYGRVLQRPLFYDSDIDVTRVSGILYLNHAWRTNLDASNGTYELWEDEHPCFIYENDDYHVRVFITGLRYERTNQQNTGTPTES